MSIPPGRDTEKSSMGGGGGGGVPLLNGIAQSSLAFIYMGKSLIIIVAKGSKISRTWLY